MQACSLSFFLIAISLGFLSADKVYIWIVDPHMLDHFYGKNIWLQKNFMVIRNLLSVVVICSVSCWQLTRVLNRDKKAINSSSDLEKSALQTTSKLRHWSAPVCVIYSIAFSILCFDLLMSLSPLWFSTLWAAWIFSIGMQTLMATLLIVMFLLKKTPVGEHYSTKQFHDVGKLLHGFTIFFAYLTYAHVLTYWYGNVPEETEYFLHRLHQPWLSIVLIAPIFSFAIPLFALIPKAAKYTPVYTPIICTIILIAQWFTFLLVVMPEIVHTKSLYLPFLEMGVFVGVFGLFCFTILRFGQKNSMVSLADPIWADSDH